MRLNEGLDYHDMKGKDSDIVTLTFKTNSKLSAEDLVAWLEIGYDYILDASVSDGEIEPGKWLVFVEMKRRSNIPEKIIQILEDLDTLTDIKAKDYTVTIKDEDYDADVNMLKQVMVLSPNDYKKLEDDEEELNEMRQIAGIGRKKIYDVDEEIRKFISKAGL
jgi:hypothetical protein